MSKQYIEIAGSLNIPSGYSISLLQGFSTYNDSQILDVKRAERVANRLLELVQKIKENNLAKVLEGGEVDE
jgi:hypothetical protein